MLIVIIFALAFIFIVGDMFRAWVETKNNSLTLSIFMFVLSVCLNCCAIGYFDATVIEVIVAIVISEVIPRLFRKKKIPTAAPAHA